MKFFILAAALTASCQSSPMPASDNCLTVNTTSGSFKGFIDPLFPSVKQFLGIPYGLADRWAPGKPYTSNATFNATAPPPACPQFPLTLPSVYTVSAPEFDNSNTWAEDCLGLAVWTPINTKQDSKLPVFVFIHGGGLQSGSLSTFYQQPTPWVQRTKSHIVVTIQYRLNIFGFPNAAGLEQSNFGLLDQRMAIEWVRDNIVNFGGDADRIILWGQSSGAASVDAQNFAFAKDPIVQGFIEDSGTVLFPPSTGFLTSDPNHTNFSTVAKGLGCPTAPPSAELSCMRAQPAARLVSFLGNYTAARTQPALNFLATPDASLVFADYTQRLAQGQLSDRPAIIGTNRNEGAVQAPFPPFPTVSGPNATLTQRLTLGLFACPMLQATQARTAAKRLTYNYMYAGNFSDVSPLSWEGAYHSSELPMVFGTRGMVRAPASPLEVETSEAMQDLWLAFARNPSAAQGWAQAGSSKGVVFGEGRAVQTVEDGELKGECVRLKAAMDT